MDGKTLIFANKKRDVNEIAYRVEKYGYESKKNFYKRI